MKMSKKFMRNFELRIYNRDELNPLKSVKYLEKSRCAFKIYRNSQGTDSGAKISLFNLAKDTRDWLDVPAKSDGSPNLNVSLKAGYRSEEMKLLTDSDAYCTSQWKAPNWITTFTCVDGYINGRLSMTNKPFPVGTPVSFILNYLISFDLGMTIYRMDLIPASLPRSRTFSGNTWNIIRELGQVYGFNPVIEKGQVSIISSSFPINASTILEGLPIIAQESGMIGQPYRLKDMVRVSVLMDASIVLGQYVILYSKATQLSGNYSVKEIIVEGDTHGNSWHMTLTLSTGPVVTTMSQIEDFFKSTGSAVLKNLVGG